MAPCKAYTVKLKILAHFLIFYLVLEETNDVVTDISAIIIAQMQRAGTHANNRCDYYVFLVHGLVHFQKNFKFRKMTLHKSVSHCSIYLFIAIRVMWVFINALIPSVNVFMRSIDIFCTKQTNKIHTSLAIPILNHQSRIKIQEGRWFLI